MVLQTAEEKDARFKRLNVFTALFLAITFTFILNLPTAHANVVTDAIDMIPGFPDLVRAWASQIVNGVFSPAIKMIIDPTTEFGYFYAQVKAAHFTGKFAMLGTLYNALKWCSALGLFVVAFVKFFQEMEKGRDSWDVISNLCLQLGVTGAFIINLDYFISIAVKIGDIIIRIVIDTMNISLDASQQAQNVDQFLTSLTGSSTGGLYWSLSTIITLLLPWLLSWLIEVVLQAIVLQTIIEIAIRRAFAPIAMVDIFSEGWRSPGFQWLKKIVSAFLKIAVTLVALAIVQKISAGLTGISGNSQTESTGAMAYLGRVIVVDATGFMLVHSAGQYASELLE